ncbi:two-component system sensor histidine kinase NtrB [Pseudoruegeria sp. SHC-113]|uniref:two-component system sensor histidine kinase NtrB n=1 Tax=Pseudoruegeria sp. SHC-113 TaxID=2855439 RepID=UPI0021BB0111|nr:ATP-binding protein [Pseudoruegeria sp. SHC-113]MCT8160429.1 PAS domain-containing sensor histidine kinase [Pseudoruegeria sp. SHC-113]
MKIPGTELWTSLPIPGLILDANDIISAVNPAAEGFLNLSGRSLIGTPVWDKVMIDAPLEESFARVRRDQSGLLINDVDVGSGERKPMQCNIQIAPLGESDTDVLMLISPRELAGRLGRSHSVHTSAKSAIGMAEMLAHEIKNPLAGITGAAQLLSMNLSSEDQEMTDLIVGEARRILKLLEQVEQFGNVRPPDRKPVNIHDVLDRARKSAMVGFAAHMQFVEDYDPSLPPTWADGDQLTQIFLNLFKNAAQAAEREGKSGKIVIRTFYDTSLRLRRTSGAARVPIQIEVIDDGPGLPPEIASDIFEPFVSGRENGTGLGLALVSKIISEHEGWIAVDSVPGRTVFRVSLPVAPKESMEQP